MNEIQVVGNYVELPGKSQLCKHDHPNRIMFLGKMDYEPNVTAVHYFVTKIFPFLKDKNHELEFVIVGAKPNAKVLCMGNIEGVTVTGFVESVEPYFKKSTVVVAPMLTGAGVQNKIIQAMSFGCCVATTTLGSEGIDLKGDEIAIFDSDDEWKNGMLRLLSDTEERKKMGENAIETIKKTLSKEVIYQQFKRLITDI